MIARKSDVAKKAHVSSRTVTRVLQGASNVAPETKRRVEKALRELQYAPNPVARALKTARTNLVGLIMPPPKLEVSSKKLVALEKEAHKRGYRIMLGFTETEVEQEEQYIVDFLRFCDGVLLFVDWALGVNAGSLKILSESKKPYVLIDGAPATDNSVFIDRGEGMREALVTLNELYANFVYVGVPEVAPRDVRYQTFAETLSNCKHAADVRIVPTSTESFQAGYDVGDCIASGPPTLVCCQNDKTAVGLLKRLTELEVDVPERVGIVGFDDDEFDAFAVKGMTTIAQPIDELACEVFDMFRERMETGQALPGRRLCTRFIRRSTTT